MGIAGQFDHPDYLAAVERILAAGKAHDKPIGIMASSVQVARDALAQGFRIIAYSGDIWLYQQVLSEGLAAIRA